MLCEFDIPNSRNEDYAVFKTNLEWNSKFSIYRKSFKKVTVFYREISTGFLVNVERLSGYVSDGSLINHYEDPDFFKKPNGTDFIIEMSKVKMPKERKILNPMNNRFYAENFLEWMFDWMEIPEQFKTGKYRIVFVFNLI
jgi:hypothetical protein